MASEWRCLHFKEMIIANTTQLFIMKPLYIRKIDFFKNLKYFLFIGLTLSSVGCKKPLYSAADGLFICDNDVYIAGSISQGTSMTDCPTLWKNGIPQSIGETGNFNNATSVFVDGNDIYAVINENDIGYLWKNGDKIDIYADEVNSVFVYEGNVYIAGTMNDKPTLWINGHPKYLATSSGSAKKICVYNGDVYATGYIGSILGNSSAVLWKNGNLHKLADSGEAYDIIFDDNGNIYIAGVMNNYATLWIDGDPVILENRKSTAYSVAIFKDDVYVGGLGFDSTGRSCSRLWKNGAIIHEHMDMGYQIKALASTSDTLYIAGTGKDIIPIWKITE